MAIAFAGTAPFGAAVLDGLIAQHRDCVRLVISQPSRPAGRGRAIRAPAVAQLAAERGLPLIQPERTHDPEVLAELARLEIDTIVVAAFGQMIREPLLSDFTLLNVHGSLLPLYRGAAPVERSIIDGHAQTGVCIMAMEAGLDTGAVAYRAELAIGPDEDAGSVYERMASAGVTGLLTVLGQLADGTVVWTEQDSALATYAHKITAADRALDPRATAHDLHNAIRGLSPHIGAFLTLADGARLGVWASEITDETSPGEPGAMRNELGRLMLDSADWTMELTEIQPAGKRRMAAADWLRGLQSELPHAVAPPVAEP